MEQKNTTHWNLTVQTVDAVLSYLAKQPYMEVFQVIEALRVEIRAQQAPQVPTLVSSTETTDAAKSEAQ